MSEVDILREIEKHRKAIEYLKSLDQAAGGGGAPHDVLSVTHTDTDGIGTELVDDYLYFDGADWRPRLPLYAKTITVGSGGITINNYDPGGEYQCYRAYPSSTFTGFARGVAGKILLICSQLTDAGGEITINFESGDSAATNRVWGQAGQSVSFRAFCILKYDETYSGGRWLYVSHSDYPYQVMRPAYLQSRSWFGV